jgi:hypothetical protein
MRYQIFRTVSTLSLLITLSVFTGKVSAFPQCPSCARLSVQYAASTTTQTANPQDAEYFREADLTAVSAISQQQRSVGITDVLWSRLVMLLASVF